MRIRLIQPPLVQPRYRQLTLPVVGALLAGEGLAVETCDENVQPLDRSPVDLVGISCHVYNAPRAFAIAREFRRRGTPVILGGTFPTVAPHLCQPHADSVVVGELENQVAEVVRDARAGALRPRYRAATPPDLSRTVRPDFGLIDSRRYLRFNFPLEVSRGCRFSCRFCTAHTLFPRPRTRSLDDIARDLDRHDHGLVELVDVNFLNDARFFDGVLPLLRRAPIPGWMGQTTVADLAADPTLPARLADSRCRAVFVGLESISAAELRSIRKGWSRPPAFLEVARRLREEGVLVQAGVIVGLEEAELGTLDRLADFLEEARVQTVTITYLHYFPGTPVFERLRGEGRLLTTALSDYDGNHPVIRPRRLTVVQLQREVAGFLQRMFAARSIGWRALHAGMGRHPVQLLHHLLLNGALGAYYRELVAGAGEGSGWSREVRGATLAPDEPRGRGAGPVGGAPADGDGGVEKLVADAGTWLLERLWSR